MSEVVILLPVAISGLFILASLIWSVLRLREARLLLKIMHAISIAAILGAGTSFYTGSLPLLLASGLALVLSSLATLLYDRVPSRWLALIQLSAGIMLASGLIPTLIGT